ncbi:hypothetical protein ENUP19_0062G0041 [Entamoeba nuttalli]|uniref:Uncharacterized protein n=2 Tax=Entamoeba nuttalli TaxID=412467 RepID=K2H4D4_ENTNP|nr:hypothetical protein ENU1_200720 [Entamoeba nuttalli P19]EKE37339.1 hypothetical protein ENU1_200720 [Entamoeba nuttalli P19]|eukprot:XP_008860328.1 hypothetical protein ENU1_200720 [Entamoeba nuttalli P19]
MLCVPYKRRFEDDDDENQIQRNQIQFHMIKMFPMLRRMKFDESFLQGKRYVEDLPTDGESQKQEKPPIKEQTIVPMEVYHPVDWKPKMVKELEHVGYQPNPLLDRVFWKKPSNAMIVYQEPNHCVKQMINSKLNTTQNTPSKMMDLC